MSARRLAHIATRSLLVLLTSLLAPGCGEEPATRPASGGAARDVTPDRPLPNIIVYLVDTLRADHLGVYGYPRDTSPTIDALAAQSATFEQAFSQAPWTLSSVASLFTSTYPASHQVVSNFHKVGEQATTMVEFFQGLGYHTVGFVANTLGGKGAGLDQGYEHFHELPSYNKVTPEQIAAGALTMKALYEWARGYDGQRPYFAWVHTIEPHSPYEGNSGRAPYFTGTAQEKEQLNALVGEHRGLIGRQNRGELTLEDAARLETVNAELPGRLQGVLDLYDGDVRRADDNFGMLLTILKKRPRWEDTVIVVLADHGEEFYEHDNWLHGQSVFQELVHVPLILRIPGLTDSGRRVSAPVELIDVLPTLADLLGVDPLPGWQGRSLLPLVSGAPDSAAAPADPALSMRINVDSPLGGAGGERETAFVQDGWKLIIHHDTERTSLFHLAEDPLEQRELSAEQPQRRDALLRAAQTQLRELPVLPIRKSGPEDPALEEEKLQRLIELGYVEGERRDTEAGPDAGAGHPDDH